jgi:DUF1680 family protein
MTTTRRSFLQSVALAAVAAPATDGPLEEFRYSDVQLAPGLAQTQFEQTQAILLGMNEDSLLKPWRLRAGLPAPGPEMGGWYDELPLDKTESGGHGFAPAHSFGQWISALARGYAVNHDARTKAKLEKILALYEPAISGRFYKNFRFPAYNYDKLVIGLIDAQYIARLPQAGRLLELTTDAAEPHLPPHALDRDEPQRRWRESIGENTANDYTWDESYTSAENLYLAYQRGAGDRYRALARRFLLDETYFNPLAEGKNVLGNHHAYSFCNALSSAMQAYLVDGSEKHLRAASNAFDMIATTQSFATGGWGPNESFSAIGSDDLYKSLTETHRGFETPCGSYAHFKLTRYLLRVTKDGRYGDSMERVLYNTVLGAKALQADGRAFYYSDYSFGAAKTYFPDAWPCCSGTLPQVAADYRILTYFRDGRGVFVNLYLPSELTWINAEGAQVRLTQAGDYPQGERVSLRIESSRPSTFALRFRIPAWSVATIRVNGAQAAATMKAGFATIEQTWKTGDRVDLRLASQVRLEPIDAKHPDTVAVVRGPLVQFAIGKDPVTIRREKPIQGTFKTFMEIEGENYSTYVKVT